VEAGLCHCGLDPQSMFPRSLRARPAIHGFCLLRSPRGCDGRHSGRGDRLPAHPRYAPCRRSGGVSLPLGLTAHAPSAARPRDGASTCPEAGMQSVAAVKRESATGGAPLRLGNAAPGRAGTRIKPRRLRRMVLRPARFSALRHHARRTCLSGAITRSRSELCGVGRKAVRRREVGSVSDDRRSPRVPARPGAALLREVDERNEQPGLRIKSAMTTEAWIAGQARNDNLTAARFEYWQATPTGGWCETD
jgi:hypothetical protein